MAQKINQKLVVLVIASIIIQVLFLFFFIGKVGEQELINGDAFEYYSLGKNLLEHGKFAMDLSPQTLTESFRTPLYPSFIALSLAIYNQIWFVALIQIILSAFNLILIYRLASFFLDKNWAWLPCLLFVLNPFVWYLTIILATETLFLFFLLLAVYYLFKYLEQFKIKYIILSVLPLAASALIRPASYYLFFIILFLLLVLVYKKNKDFRQLAVIFLIFLVSYAFIILPWQYRNHKIFDSWQLSSVQNYNLYFYNARLLYAEVNNLPKFEVRQEFINQANQKFAQQQAEFDNYTMSLYASGYYRQSALKIITQNPLTYIKLQLIGFIPFFTDAGWRHVLGELQIDLGQAQSLSALLSQGKIIEIFKNITQNPRYLLVFSLGKIYYLSLLILAISSIFIWPKTKRPLLYFLLMLIAYFALISGPVSAARFRYPAEIFILILASFSLCYFLRKIRKKSYVTR